MNKNEYLDQLSKLLADISYEEHEEALSYYREYIEDAGIENEQRVIEELGTPEHLAQEIREGLFKKGEPSRRQGTPINAPELSAGGSSGNYSSQYNGDNHAANAKQEKDKSNTILIIILLILTSPIWFSIACTVISVVFAFIVAIAAIAIGIGAAGIVCTVTGIALIVSGILELVPPATLNILEGAALIGAGLVVLALGILLIVLTVWLFGWALPALVRFIRQTVSRVSRKRKEAHA